MSGTTGDRRPDLGTYECVEPALGAALWRIDLPDTPAELRQRLEDHRVVCDACRLQQAAGVRIQRGLASGSLRLPASLPPLGARKAALVRSAAGGVVGLAAAFALLFLAPPPRPDHEAQVRGGAASRFLRPVEGEVLRGAEIPLAWQPLPGATAYRVTLRQIDGPYAWKGVTPESELTVPAASSPPRGVRIRALLEPLPEDLATPGSISVVFERGTASEYLAYRIRIAPLVAWLLGGTGALILLATLAAALFSRGRPAFSGSGG